MLRARTLALLTCCLLAIGCGSKEEPAAPLPGAGVTEADTSALDPGAGDGLEAGEEALQGDEVEAPAPADEGASSGAGVSATPPAAAPGAP